MEDWGNAQALEALEAVGAFLVCSLDTRTKVPKGVHLFFLLQRSFPVDVAMATTSSQRVKSQNQTHLLVAVSQRKLKRAPPPAECSLLQKPTSNVLNANCP